MKNLIPIAIFTGVYLLPAFIVWRVIHQEHSKGGERYGSNPEVGHVAITILPIFNFVIAFTICFENIWIIIGGKNLMTSTFFGIKKH